MESVEPITALKRYPEIAQRVGLIVAEYALLEHFLFICHALMAKTTTAESFNDFYRLRSLNLRCELLLNHSEALHPILRNVLSRILRRFKKAADRRTEVAHCMYLAPQGAIQRMRFTADGVRYEPMDEAVFSRTIRQYRTLGTDLLALAMHLSGDVARLQRILSEIPRPPGTSLQWNAPAQTDRPAQPTLDEIGAAISRLGLDRLPKPLSFLSYTHDAPGTALRFAQTEPKTSGN